MKPRPPRRHVQKIVSWIAARFEINRNPNVPFLIEIDSRTLGCYLPIQDLFVSRLNFKQIKEKYGISLNRVNREYIITH